MEENIYFTNNRFDFSKLSLAKPQQIPGGNYFMRLCVSNSQEPFYFRLPECTIKQGFMKTGKKFYTDLMFTNDNSEFIEFMEGLETKCMQMIFENSGQWFEDKMEMHDIENYFTAPLKIYKSGKFYNLRINIATNLGKPMLKIYDENENLVSLDDIKEKTNVLSIIEIKGIRCSSTTFQLEFEAKQMMMVEPNKMFEKCLFRPKTNQPADNNIQINPHYQENMTPHRKIVIEKDEHETVNTVIGENNKPINDLAIEQIGKEEFTLEEEMTQETTVNNLEEKPEALHLEKNNDTMIPEDRDTEKTAIENTEIVDNNEETLEKLQNEEKEDLEEIHLTLDKINENDSFSIKNKNSVYYDMYKEAKRKAKVARDLALSSYLEAKRIKNLYMLEDTTDSDSDSDSEENEESDNDEGNEENEEDI